MGGVGTEDKIQPISPKSHTKAVVPFYKTSTKNRIIYFCGKMLQEKLEQLVKMLEKQELENSIQDPKLYHELFAAYLYLDDL